MKKNHNNKLILKKTTISNLNIKMLRKVIGGKSIECDSEITSEATVKITESSNCPPPLPPPPTTPAE